MQEEFNKLQRKIERLQEDKMRCYESFVSGELSKDEFLLKKTAAAEQEGAARAQLGIFSKRLEEKRKEEKELARQMTENQQLVQYQEVTELTVELTKKLIKEIIVFPNQRIKIVWNFTDGIADLAKTIEISQMDQAI